MGFMTAEFVNFLEKIAYYSARQQYCIPERESQKVAMPEIFDMISGSETGALIAATLVIPNYNKSSEQINQWFADETSQFFWDNAATIYVDQQMPFWLNLVISLGGIVFVGFLVFYCLSKKYKLSPGYEDKIEQLSLYIENQKDLLDRNHVVKDSRNDELQQLFKDERDLELHKILITAQNSHD
jgi:hypothetical protein